jgi:hypothetical protein
MKTRRLILVAMCAWTLVAPSVASAQATRLGPTLNLGGSTSPVILPDVAHDPVNNRWLQVAGNGFIEGHLLNAAGTTIATIHVNASGGYVQNPRVEYGADVAAGAGGYLVTWHETIGNLAYVRGRLVAADGSLIGGDIPIGPGGSSWLAGAAIAYSTRSSEFLVAWVGSFGISDDIHAQRVSSNGSLAGGLVLISNGSLDWDREPSVAYNPDTDQFYVAYASYSRANFGYVSGRRIQAGTGAYVGDIQQFAANLASRIPSVTYNPDARQYLLVWHHTYSGGAAFYGQVLNGADAAPVGGLRVISSYYVAYDALDVDYNPPSGEFLLVTHGRNWEDAAVSIRGTGDPIDNGFVLTNTPDVRALKADPARNDGNYNPRVAASKVEKKWLTVTSSVFASVSAQFAASGGTGGGTPPPPGPAPAPPPPPQPPTAPATRLAVDSPVSGGTYAGRVLVQGWAADIAAGSGTGVDAVHVWAFPADGSPGIFIGATALGLARMDVGAFLGSSRFINSGYQVVARLNPGTYDIGVYAHSTVANTFNTVQVVRVVVTPPPSEPLMIVDLPAVNQTLSQNVLVSGWAIDKTADAGCGVDAVHVWAYPIVNGVYQTPVWVGAATVGVPRADVAASFGMARLGSAGFVLSGALPRGDYDLVVFARSTVTGTFNNWRMVRIRIV